MEAVYWVFMVVGWVGFGVLGGVMWSNRWWLNRVTWQPTAPRAGYRDIGVVANPVEPDDEAQVAKIQVDRELWVQEMMRETGVDEKEAVEQVDSMMGELGLL